MQSHDSPVHSHPNPHASQFHALERQAEWPPAHTTASAIQRLSPDILYEIFANCLPSVLSNELSRVAPFNLSTVCKLWREVVLGAPLLWASLEIGTFASIYRKNPSDASPGRILRSLETWLEKSKCSPFNIKLFVSSGRAPEEIVQAVKVILRSQHRWRNCEIFYQSQEESPIVSGIDTVLRCEHNLQKLDVFFDNSKHLDAYCFRLNTQHATNLSEITTGMVFFTLPVGRMESLTSLRVTVPVANFSALLRVFRNAPNLSKAMIEIRGDDYFGSRNTPRITSNKLEKLHLYIEQDNLFSMSYFLNCLCAPSLKELEIAPLQEDHELPASNVWTDLSGFIECSRPPLEKLVLQSRGTVPNPHSYSKLRVEENPPSDEAILSMLMGLPTLKHLEIVGFIASTWLFDALARDRVEASGGVLCPLLKEIVEAFEGYDRFRLLQEKSTAFKEFWERW